MDNRKRTRFFFFALAILFIVALNLHTLSKRNQGWQEVTNAAEEEWDKLSKQQPVEDFSANEDSSLDNQGSEYCGAYVSGQPQQQEKSEETTERRGVFSITHTHSIEVIGRVISVSPTLPYNDNANKGLSKVVPLNVLIGWGPFDTDQTYEGINFWQAGTWWKYEYRNDFPLPRCAIVWNIAQLSLVFKNGDIERQAYNLRVGDRVRLTGDLVNLRNEETNRLWKWNSSLTRGDEGENSTEILYLESIEKLN